MIILKKLTSEIKLFDSLLDMEFNDSHYDLHNDYDYTRFEYSEKDRIISHHFINRATKHNLKILFNEVAISVIDIPFNDVDGFLTLANFYRGRFLADETLSDLSHDGKAYIYMEYCEGQTFEYFAKEIIIKIMK